MIPLEARLIQLQNRLISRGLTLKHARIVIEETAPILRNADVMAQAQAEVRKLENPSDALEERVAKAIYDAEQDNVFLAWHGKPFSDESAAVKIHYLTMASAAIKALRQA